MKMNLLFLTFLLLPLLCGAQLVLDDFDTLVDTSRYTIYVGPAGTYLHPVLETTTVHDGTGAARLEWQNRCYDQWGGWIGITNDYPVAGETYDFSVYTNITFWYYNAVKQSKTNQVEFRLIFRENGPGTDESLESYEIWFSHHYILDNGPGWNKIDVKMEDVGIQTGTGFWNPGWGQTAEGDQILQLDKIKGWTMEFSQSSGLYQQPDDSVSGVLILDQLQLEGVAPVNLVFFNGKANPSNINLSVGWSGSAEITDEVSFDEGTNSIKWSNASAWDAVNFTLAQPRNMLFNWGTDSLQFKIKADAGIGDLNIFFWDVDHDGAEKADYGFPATYILTENSMDYNGTWKQVKIPLRSFNRFAGIWDNDLGKSVAGEFDSTEIQGFAIGSNGQDFAGKAVYFDDVWTGNPEFDWTPPEMVTGVTAAKADYYNLVFWNGLTNETGETYTLYASNEPITDITDPGLEIVAEGVDESVTSVPHWLYYPQADKNVTFYYAVVCTDASGNAGPAGLSEATTNLAQGIATIADHAPASFAADGDLSEWDGFMPWEITPGNNNTAAGQFTDDADLTATVYLAMDESNLYVGANVLDNAFEYDSANVANNWWNEDAFEFFIGLWDQNGKSIHSKSPSSNRGTEPDYKLIFLPDRYFNEYKNTFLGLGGNAEFTSGSGNYYHEVIGGTDYSFEARIPLADIAFDTDVVFHPQRGMRLMFDLVFHDADGAGWEGNLSWSPNNRDLAYLDQHEWTFTWIGDTTHTVTAIDNRQNQGLLHSFMLSQNYPNPFNPATTIEYEVAEHTSVKIELFDVLGQKNRTLTNVVHTPGRYKLTLDASELSSGVYFYKMQAGNFMQVRKMLLFR